MNKQSRWINLILFAVFIGLMVIGRYFGWLSSAPPLYAPGLQ
jgi:hypothetical protein